VILHNFTYVVAIAFLTVPAYANNISFGDNKSEWANDHECDDRRFRGPGMASDLDNDDNGHDANDCRKLFNLGEIKLWIERDAKVATQCSKINFGNNKSEYAKDGECDDPRFEGPGMSSILATDDIGLDAKDCQKHCQNGQVFLRNY